MKFKLHHWYEYTNDEGYKYKYIAILDDTRYLLIGSIFVSTHSAVNEPKAWKRLGKVSKLEKLVYGI